MKWIDSKRLLVGYYESIGYKLNYGFKNFEVVVSYIIMVFELKCKILRWAYLEVGEIPSVLDIDEKILGDVRLFG